MAANNWFKKALDKALMDSPLRDARIVPALMIVPFELRPYFGTKFKDRHESTRDSRKLVATNLREFISHLAMPKDGCVPVFRCVDLPIYAEAKTEASIKRVWTVWEFYTAMTCIPVEQADKLGLKPYFPVEKEEQAIPPRPCVECRHHWIPNGGSSHFCNRPPIPRSFENWDPVLGKARNNLLSCYDQRTGSASASVCGFEGRYFVAREGK